MPTFKCEICDSYQVYSSEMPEFCPNCGAQKGPWKKIKDDFKITNSIYKFIIYRTQEFGRKEIKNFFSEVRDDAGNGIYKYCEPDRAMLLFSLEDDGKIFVQAILSTKNYFLINSERISNTKIPINKRDTLVFVSSTSGSEIARFEII